jgi:hypothetical protein
MQIQQRQCTGIGSVMKTVKGRRISTAHSLAQQSGGICTATGTEQTPFRSSDVRAFEVEKLLGQQLEIVSWPEHG